MTDTLKSELIPLYENPDRVTHELLGDLKHLGRHGSREKDDLSFGGKELENIVDRVFESSGEHLVSLVKTEHLDSVGFESSTVDHVKHSARGTNDNVRAVVEFSDVFPDGGTTNTSVAVNVEVIAKGNHNLLDLLCELSGRGEDECLGLLDRCIYLLSSACCFHTVKLNSPSAEWRQRRLRSCRFPTELERYNHAQ